MSLTAKRKRFVSEYLVDLNATRAYRAAGFSGSDNVCAVEGLKLLRNPNVAAAIAEAQAKRSARTEITQDMVLRELAKIGFADMRRLLKWTGNQALMDLDAAEDSGDVEIRYSNLVTLFDSDELPDDVAASVAEISQTKDGALKVKLYDKRAALVDIGRHLGMFTTKIEHSGQVDINHQVNADADAFTRSIAGIAARTGAAGGTGETQH